MALEVDGVEPVAGDFSECSLEKPSRRRIQMRTNYEVTKAISDELLDIVAVLPTVASDSRSCCLCCFTRTSKLARPTARPAWLTDAFPPNQVSVTSRCFY